jgi:Raf kinase inhibitor-like YbhB/YbcL family protein
MMTLTSPSFGHGDLIPKIHAADGPNRSPPLTWADPPQGTKSLALLVEDPDAPDPAAPQRIFAHWVVYNLPPSAGYLALGANRDGLPTGARPGRNDFGKIGYGGPAPPVGRHRYFFRLFALDTVLSESELGQPDRGALLKAMTGHILEEAELMGTYERGRAEPQPRPARV